MFIIGVTNNLKMIDTSILRSGRLECHIGFSLPTPGDRKCIIEDLMKNVYFSNEQEKNEIIEWLVNRTSFKSIAAVKGLVERIIVKYVTEKLAFLTKNYLIEHFWYVCYYDTSHQSINNCN